MSALDEFKTYEAPCPECGGEVEYFYFDGDCRGNASSSGIQCKQCKREFTKAEWTAVENKVLLEKANRLTEPYGLKAEFLSEDACSVGVQGDQRTYTPIINLVGKHPGVPELQKVSSEICNTLKINRVTFQPVF